MPRTILALARMPKATEMPETVWTAIKLKIFTVKCEKLVRKAKNWREKNKHKKSKNLLFLV
jgi:hypothetical protein